MATHRRTLASTMERTYPNPTPSSTSTTTTTTTEEPHPTPSPPPPPPSSIETISNNFSRLYTNHKLLTSLKSSTTAAAAGGGLTKSKSQHARITHHPTYYHHDDTKVKDKVVKEAIVETKKPFSGGGGGRRRRSFGSSMEAELADFLSCNGVRVVSVDMPPFMQIHAVDCARKAYDSLEKFTAKSLAQTLKKEFDGAYGPAWHCIVGKSFGSFVTHSVGRFMYFSMDHKLYVLLFKTTVKKLD